MSALSTPEPAGIRHAVYIEELHEFLATCSLPYGSPEDIFAVTERLHSSENFFADLSSLMRSIILRERGAVVHAELLEILALAIGGPQMERAPQDFQQPLRQLLTFITGTLRRPWNQPPAEPGAVLPFPSDAPAATPAPDEPLTTTVVQSEEAKLPVAASPAGFDASKQIPEQILPSTPVPVREPSAAHPPSAPPDTSGPEHAPSLFPPRKPARAAALSPQAVAAALPPASPARNSKSARWIPLAAAAALGLLVLLAIKLRHPASPATASNPAPSLSTPAALPLANVSAEDASLGAATLAKPTADGPPLVAQPAPVQRIRRDADADNEEYIAPPTVHNAPGWPPTPVATPAAAPQTTTSASTLTSTSGSVPVPAPVFVPIERRTPLASSAAAGGSAARQLTYRDPDGSIVGDPLPVQAAHGRYFRVSSGVMAANLLSDPEPDYPALARLAHIQGQVILQAVIARDGTVSATRVLSGHRLLRGAAVDAVRRWRYRPYLADGHPVDVDTIITVEFHNWD